MCGICGVIGLDSKQNGEAVVRRMLNAIVHRGPDEEGFLAAPPVVVGARRLSIIDLPGGSQPIWNETGTLAVVFNGEIYNFRELRKELESKGHIFLTRSDTEVIVHAYEQWGEQSAARLRGMFALAIVEMPQGRGGAAASVFLARDPLGIKPLYYAMGAGGLLFASEVRALLASGCISPQLSTAAIPSYLLFGSVCEPMTMIEGVLSLPPGHFVKIRAHDPRRVPSQDSTGISSRSFISTRTPRLELPTRRIFPPPPPPFVRCWKIPSAAISSRMFPSACFSAAAWIRQPSPRSPATCKKAFILLPSHSPTPNSAKAKSRATPRSAWGPTIAR